MLIIGFNAIIKKDIRVFRSENDAKNPLLYKEAAEKDERG